MPLSITQIRWRQGENGCNMGQDGGLLTTAKHITPRFSVTRHTTYSKTLFSITRQLIRRVNNGMAIITALGLTICFYLILKQ
jgi:hypothetical protein